MIDDWVHNEYTKLKMFYVFVKKNQELKQYKTFLTDYTQKMHFMSLVDMNSHLTVKPYNSSVTAILRAMTNTFFLAPSLEVVKIYIYFFF